MLCIGNWKMSGSQQWLASLAKLLEEQAGQLEGVEVVVLPPFTHLGLAVQSLAQLGVLVGGQTACSYAESGAYTGGVSCSLIRDAGGRAVLAGHSERRRWFGEQLSETMAQVAAGLRQQLKVIVCVGETAEERRAGGMSGVISEFTGQLNQLLAGLGRPGHELDLVVAYEPVWAIGTGVTPTLAEIAEAVGLISEQLSCPNIPIVYGGSVTRSNLTELLTVKGVSGFLVGGASLSAEFVEICQGCCRR